MSPALLLALPATLIAEGRDGLWLGLLFVVAPLFASVAIGSRRAAGRAGGVQTLPLFPMLLVVGLVMWANLGLAGDVATWMAVPRWRGVVPAAGAALALIVWPRSARHWPWVLPAGLVALWLPVAVVIQASRADPIQTWGQVASLPAFRFPADSPWVRQGRAVGSRRGSFALRFDEEHRVTPLDPGPLRIEVSDLGRRQIQEWTLAPGQSVTLRPGDRLQVDGAPRFKFEADKRVPGAPASGIAWADASRASPGVALIRILGLGLTLLAGAAGLAGFAMPGAPTRAGVALGALVFLAALGWALAWAIYSARWAPEFFLRTNTAATLLELPALVLRGTPWGFVLVGLSLLGLLALFLAGSVALREELAVSDPPALASDRGLWGGMLGVAALAALWPVEPRALFLGALGLGASTLAPLVFFASPAAGPARAAWAVGVGLTLFVALTAVARVGVPSGALAQALLAYPALVAAPVAAGILRVARRPAPP